MNGYWLKAYLKHIKKSKGRHGIHSPFVFDFIENVLRKKQKQNSNFILATKQNSSLINQIVQYYQCREILWISKSPNEPQSFIRILQKDDHHATVISKEILLANLAQFPYPDLVLFDVTNPQEWQSIYDKLNPFIKRNTLLLISSIHQTEVHAKGWETLLINPNVTLSLDLFSLGILLFRGEFLVKQRFMLK